MICLAEVKKQKQKGLIPAITRSAFCPSTSNLSWKLPVQASVPAISSPLFSVAWLSNARKKSPVFDKFQVVQETCCR